MRQRSLASQVEFEKYGRKSRREFLPGEERKAWGDGGYQGQTEAIKQAAPKAQT